MHLAVQELRMPFLDPVRLWLTWQPTRLRLSSLLQQASNRRTGMRSALRAQATLHLWFLVYL